MQLAAAHEVVEGWPAWEVAEAAAAQEVGAAVPLSAAVTAERFQEVANAARAEISAQLSHESAIQAYRPSRLGSAVLRMYYGSVDEHAAGGQHLLSKGRLVGYWGSCGSSGLREREGVSLEARGLWRGGSPPLERVWHIEALAQQRGWAPFLNRPANACRRLHLQQSMRQLRPAWIIWRTL